jgi:glycerol-3-phosphate acyltransferase PlsY
MNIGIPLLIFLLAYIVGSFPSAYIIGRLNRINIFEVGSGNMGANNVIRSLGLKWGIVVVALDVTKGVIGVLIGRLIMPWDPISGGVIGAIAVVIGHNWSVLATLLTGRLRGGKGVATAAGTMFLMAPIHVIAITLALWALIVILTRYVSLGALVGTAIGCGVMLLMIAQQQIYNISIPPSYSIYSLALTAMIYLRHWKNIISLLTGRERRLGERVNLSA